MMKRLISGFAILTLLLPFNVCGAQTRDVSAKVSTSGLRVPVAWSTPVTGGRKRALRVRYPVGSRARVYAVYIKRQNRPESADKE